MTANIRMDSLVSVIIPTYNCASYVQPSLDSVVQQSHKNIELILVDDCSTDDTVAQLEKFQSEHPALTIKILQLPENSGPSVARNIGLMNATGDFIAFLDSDDEWESEKTARQLAHFDADPALVIVGTSCRVKNGDFDEVIGYDEEGRIPTGWKVLLDKNIVQTSCVMIKKEALLGEFFRTDLAVAEDREFWLRISRKGELGYVSSPLTIINRIDSYMEKNIDKIFTDFIPWLEYTMKNLTHELSRQEKNRVLGYAYNSAGINLRIQGKFFASVPYSLKAIIRGYKVKNNIMGLIVGFPPLKMLKEKLIKKRA